MNDGVTASPTTPACATSTACVHVVTQHWRARVLAVTTLLVLVACIAGVSMKEGNVNVGIACVIGFMGFLSESRATWLRVSSTTIEVWTQWPGCRRVLTQSVPRSSCDGVVAKGSTSLRTPQGSVALPGRVDGKRVATILGVDLVEAVLADEDGNTLHDEIVKNRP